MKPQKFDRKCINCLYYDKRHCLILDDTVQPFTACDAHIFHNEVKIMYDFQAEKYHLYNDANEIVYTDANYRRTVKQHNILQNQNIATELSEESLNTDLSSQEWDELANITPDDLQRALEEWENIAPSSFKNILKAE